MRFKPMIVRLARLTLFAVGLAMVAASARAKEKWIRAQTEHFELLSSAPEASARLLLNDLEQFRASFLKVMGFKLVRAPRTTVVLFSTDSEFEPFKPLYNGKPKDIAAYCVSSDDETVIALPDSYDADETRQIIFHEYVHLLIHAMRVEMPVWMEEGYAELFATFKIENGKISFGAPHPYHVMLLNRTLLMPLETLFSVTRSSPEYNEGLRQGMFYAQSWALLHFLICGNKIDQGDAKLQRFADLLAKNRGDVKEVFSEAFGMTTKQMEASLRAYLRGGTYFKRTGELELPDLAGKITFSPATEFEREIALANLKWRVHENGDAAWRIMEIGKLAPDSPRTYELLGAIALRANDPYVGLDHLRRAVELGSTNPYAYVMLTQQVVRTRLHTASLDDRLVGPTLVELRAWCAQALKLSPNDEEALELLGFVEAMADSPVRENTRLVQSSRPRQRDTTARTLLAIAIIRWRAGDAATAVKIAGLLEKEDILKPPHSSLLVELTGRLRAGSAAAPSATPGG